jgi:hypothetical protein
MDFLFVQRAGLKLQFAFLNLQSYRPLVVDQMWRCDLVEELVHKANSLSLAASSKSLEKIPHIPTIKTGTDTNWCNSEYEREKKRV